MRFKLPGVLRWAVTRVGFLYLLAAAAALLLVDFDAASARIKIRRLNDGRPQMISLVSFGKGEVPADKLDWKPYLNYFALVVRYMPGEEVTKMFLGLCEYYTGDPHRTAWGHIQRSAEAYPFIFWSLYNAGVLAFERGDMGLAARYLERAMAIPPERAAMAMKGSTVYRQLMASSNFNVELMDGVRAAREDVYLLLAAASFYARDHQKAVSLALYALDNIEIRDKEPFYFYVGAASMGLGKVREAAAFFGQSLALGSRNPQAYRYMAEILKASGKTETAGDLLRTAAALEKQRKAGFPYPERLRLRFF